MCGSDTGQIQQSQAGLDSGKKIGPTPHLVDGDVAHFFGINDVKGRHSLNENDIRSI